MFAKNNVVYGFTRRIDCCRPFKHTVVKAFNVVDISRHIGDGIGAFTLFYCTLNFIMYKRTIDRVVQYEKQKDADTDKKKKDKSDNVE